MSWNNKVEIETRCYLIGHGCY